jgi:DNA polymerase-4/DNA polymerase V
MNSPRLSSIPHKSRYILHIDGDAFFASVEQAKNHKLKGKPVITGLERGIAAAFSYEAKAKGVTRGMRIGEIKKVCPEAILLDSDYEMYCIFARRMYNIVRRYTPHVEEYSIDECFADITDVTLPHGMTHAEYAFNIKKDLEMKLGITFGVGLAPNKVLAKVASKHKKPAGFTVIKKEDIVSFIKQLPIHKVWGIGGAMSMYLRQRGIETAYDFAIKDDAWMRVNQIAKPYKEIWLEFQGYFVKELSTAASPASDIGSIMKSRTFTPATSDRQFFHGVSSRAITFYLKTSEFRYRSVEINLPLATSSPNELLKVVRQYFDQVYNARTLYRTSGITLRSLIEEEAVTRDLFGQSEIAESSDKVFSVVDDLKKTFGSHTVFLGSSMSALQKSDYESKHVGFRERRINIPFVGIALCM